MRRIPAASSCHFFAGFGAEAARIRAFFHIPDAVAIGCASFTNLAAQAAGAFVQLRAGHHDMCRRPAHFGACHHQAEVLLFGVLSACF
jgi:hypothetical protein